MTTLKEYLEKLKICPDDKLTARLGIYDNWPILLNMDTGQLVNHLIENNFTIRERSNSVIFLDYNLGIVVAQVTKGMGFTTGGESKWLRKKYEAIRKHYERQNRDFNLTMILHPYGKKVEGVNWRRAFANIIEDIGEYVQRENIPLCFPRSYGFDDIDEVGSQRKESTLSKIVYFYPDNQSSQGESK